MVVAVVVITWLLITRTTGMKWWCSLHFCTCLFIYLLTFFCRLKPQSQTYKQKWAKNKTPDKI